MLVALLLVSCGGGGGGSSETGTPGVSITGPADGTSVAEGTSINFLATANDAEDGDLGTSLNWNSNIDGDFGTGSDVNATLSVGVHTIIASVTDSGGLPGSQQITVTVTANQAGLDARPQNADCVAPDRTVGDVPIALVDAFPGLPGISDMVKVLVEPVPDPRWFVLRKTGQLLVFDPANATSTSVYLDLSDAVKVGGESGLLGMAFHPDYPTVPEIFLSYTRDHTGPSMRSVFARFILDNIASPGLGTVEQVILEVDQDNGNHNGGDIAFGPDRMLYIGLGDGGGGGDPFERAQDTRYLLGSFLRIDVLGSAVAWPANPYAIPATNPFAGNPKCGPGVNAAACPEIYAWGLRNPWRWSFDLPTGILWAADVGQADWEEINRIELGGNYGWDCREGAHDFEIDACASGLIDPVAEYDHDAGRSITGGFVYRGSANPALYGRYVFADFSSGRIWALKANTAGGFDLEELLDTANVSPSAFAVDGDNELYVVGYSGGRILRLESEASEFIDTVPDDLADSGCVDPNDATLPYSGLVPFEPSAPFWSDGAAKERFIGIPDGTTIAIDGEDDFLFPPGTVLVKNFRLDGKLVETRHLMRHPDGEWAGYTYEWNAEETQALRVRGGKSVMIAGQEWVYPSQIECRDCHTGAADIALGPETAQLNGPLVYPQTGRSANQMQTLDAAMMLSSPLPPIDTLPALADPADTSVPLEERARAYLYTNCAQCHQPGGPTSVVLDFRYTTALQDTYACNGIPLRGNVGLDFDARIIFPGDAAKSVLIARMARRDSAAMPPLGSTVVDAAGLALMTEWIDGLEGCN